MSETPITVEVVCPRKHNRPSPYSIGYPVKCGFCGEPVDADGGSGAATLVPGSRAALEVELARAVLIWDATCDSEDDAAALEQYEEEVGARIAALRAYYSAHPEEAPR